MIKNIITISAICIIVPCLFFFWYQSGRKIVNIPAILDPDNIINYGVNKNRGNLIAIQPFMLPSDYASEYNFKTKIETYLLAARQKNWLNPKTIVALPEYIGTWLVTAEEKGSVYTAPNINKAMGTMLLCNIFSFFKELPFAKAEDGVRYSLFKMKAKKAASIYQHVFSELAKKYGITIVAGSIILPSPRINQGKLETGNGRLYNVSIVYKPDGMAYESIVRKVFLVKEEQSFLTKAPVDELPVFETPAGKLGVLICADAWYPLSYTALKSRKVDLIIVPSYLESDGSFIRPWHGYNGYPAPDDVNLKDINRITEGEACIKYSLAGRMHTAGALYGVNVFLRGKLWDLGSDGETIIINRGKIIKAKNNSGAAILNCWLS